MHSRFRVCSAVMVASLVACGGAGNPGLGGPADGGGPGSSSSGGGSSSGSSSGADASSSGGKDAGKSDSGSGSSSGVSIGTVSCSAPSTGWAKDHSGTCGSWRWAVKTGTDDDIGKVDLTPQQTIPTLVALATPGVQYGYSCMRAPPTEEQTWLLRDVDVKFEAIEADGDYHLIAKDPAAGKTMVTEVPYPGCVGHDSCQSQTPASCDITHARAAVDAWNPSQSYGMTATATIIGIGFFDTDELMNSPGPAGEAPNGVELHPILAICFGQGCNPLQGY